MGRVRIQPDADLQAHPVARGHERRRVDPLDLQAQRAQAVAHGGGEVAGRDRAQQPGLDEPRDGREAGREDRRPGAHRQPGRPSGDQGLCHRGHSPQGGVHPHRFRPLGIRPPRHAQAQEREGRREPRPGRPRSRQRLVGRQGRAPEQHHPGGGRPDRRLAGLVRHGGQGHQGRAR